MIKKDEIFNNTNIDLGTLISFKNNTFEIRKGHYFYANRIEGANNYTLLSNSISHAKDLHDLLEDDLMGVFPYCSTIHILKLLIIISKEDDI